MSPLVSVVLPIYNAEPYLRKCLDSLVGQTYESLEIILVDNASTDGSLAICREYSEKDGRIRIVCLDDNYGCGGGRNAGIAAAHGEYIGFADADDYADPDMYSYLAENAVFYQTDITMCGFYEEEGGSVRIICAPSLTRYTRDEALRELLLDRIVRNFLWQKLFRVRLFSGFSLPERCAYDDLAIYGVFKIADTFLCLPEAKYHYLIRPDSDCHRNLASVYLNRADFLLRRAEDLGKTHPHLKSFYIADIYKAFSHYNEAAAKFPENADLRGVFAPENLRILREARKDIIASGTIGFLARSELNIMCLGAKPFRMLALRTHALMIRVTVFRRNRKERRNRL